MIIYSIYKKTHNKTGLQYLGYTKQDPFKYKGSGKVWTNHIKVHGNDVTTEILYQSTEKEQIRIKGILYSEQWNVVESKEWANLKPEEADGGGNCYNHEKNKINASKGGLARANLIAAGKYDYIPWNKGVKIGPQSAETRKKKSASHTGMKRSYRPDGSWFWVKQQKPSLLQAQELLP